MKALLRKVRNWDQESEHDRLLTHQLAHGVLGAVEAYSRAVHAYARSAELEVDDALERYLTVADFGRHSHLGYMIQVRVLTMPAPPEERVTPLRGRKTEKEEATG